MSPVRCALVLGIFRGVTSQDGAPRGSRGGVRLRSGGIASLPENHGCLRVRFPPLPCAASPRLVEAYAVFPVCPLYRGPMALGSRQAFFLFLFFLGLFLWSPWSGPPASALGQILRGDVYVVPDIAVEARGPSEISAKKEALSQAGHAAFRSLISALVPPSEREALIAATKNSDIVNLTHEISILEEAFGGGLYRGTFRLGFLRDGVVDFLIAKKTPFVALEDVPLVVLPVLLQPGQAPVLWASSNAWLEVWTREATPVAVPFRPLVSTGTAEERALVSLEDLQANNRAALRRLAEQHGAEGVLITSLVLTAEGVRTSNVVLHPHIPGGGTINFQQTHDTQGTQGGARGNEAATAWQVQRELLARLRDAWTERLAFNPRRSTRLPVQVALRSLHDWVTVEKNLARALQVSSYELLAIERGRAYLTLDLLDSAERFQALSSLLGFRGLRPPAAASSSTSGASSGVTADAFWELVLPPVPS